MIDKAGSGEQLEDRLVELESRLTWQDDALRVLDEIVIDQRRELDLLRRELLSLKQQMWQLSGATGGASEPPPPHY